MPLVGFVIKDLLGNELILGAVGIDQMGPIGVLFVISIAFFVGCMFVDPIVVILVLVPIFAPVVNSVGLDPVLVGIVITLQVAIGSALETIDLA